MSKWFNIKAKKRASLKARDRANHGWRIRHAQRDAMALKDPVRVGGRIVERIVRIIGERVVRECTIFEFDRPCDIRRKKRRLFA